MREFGDASTWIPNGCRPRVTWWPLLFIPDHSETGTPTGRQPDEVMAEIMERMVPRPDLKEERLPICLVTAPDGRLLGIVTPSDLHVKYSEYHGRAAGNVSDIWTSSALSLEVGTTLAEEVRRILEMKPFRPAGRTDGRVIEFLPHAGRRELVG